MFVYSFLHLGNKRMSYFWLTSCHIFGCCRTRSEKERRLFGKYGSRPFVCKKRYFRPGAATPIMVFQRWQLRHFSLHVTNVVFKFTRIDEFVYLFQGIGLLTSNLLQCYRFCFLQDLWKIRMDFNFEKLYFSKFVKFSKFGEFWGSIDAKGLIKIDSSKKKSNQKVLFCGQISVFHAAACNCKGSSCNASTRPQPGQRFPLRMSKMLSDFLLFNPVFFRDCRRVKNFFWQIYLS